MKNSFILSFFSLAAFLILTTSAHASQQVHGVMMVVKGDVQITSAKTGKPSKARIGVKVFPKDKILAGKDSRAKIVMVDKNEINISPDSEIEIADYEFDPAKGKKNVIINVLYGKMRASVNQKYDGEENKFHVKTPSAVAGVRGTDFLTSFNKSTKASQVVTFHGQVAVGAPGPGGVILNPVLVNPGQMTTASAGAPPAPPSAVPAADLNAMKVESDAGAPPKSEQPNAPNDGPKGDKDKKEGGDKAENGQPQNQEPKKDGDKKGEGPVAGGPQGDGQKGPDQGGDKRAPASMMGGEPNAGGGGGFAMIDPNKDLGPGAVDAQPPQGPMMPPRIPNPGQFIPSIDNACGQFCLNQISNGRTRLIINVTYPQ